MSKLRLDHVKPLAIYNLAELFNAVTTYKDELESDAAKLNIAANDAPAWTLAWSPVHTLVLIDDAVTQMRDWQEPDVSYVFSNAPISDDNITGDHRDMFLNQMREKRIQPVPQILENAFKLS